MSIGKLGSIERVSRDTPLATEKAQSERDPRLLEVSRMYEKQFLREMVKAMRGTISASDLTKPSMGEEIYRGQLDEQYVESWGDTGGIGLADMVYDEIMAKFIQPNDRSARPKGPIQLTDRDISRAIRAPSSVQGQAGIRIEIKDGDGAPAKVQSPWDAKVLAKTQLEGRSTVLLEHEGGIRSALIFDGVASQMEPGQSIKRGAQLGILSPEIKSFFWNLKDAGPASFVDKPAKSGDSAETVAPLVEPAKISGLETES